MTALKTLVTLIVMGIIGLAMVIGPLPTDGGKGTPGPQSPADSSLPAAGPTPILIVGGLILAIALGFKARGSDYSDIQ